MNFRKIRLDNERSTHVTKRLNRLSTWKFFQVLYRENTWRVFGYSLLMLLFMAPIFAMIVLGKMQVSNLETSLPMLGGFGFNSGVWNGVGDFFAEQSSAISFKSGLLTVAASVLVALIFSGGFAVIRDGFWTGKLSTVGVFKSLWMGIKANILYALVCEIVLAFGLFGIILFGGWIVTVIPKWLGIILIVLLSILYLLVAVFCLILCSVTVTYKQSVGANLRDAWLLMWLNILPNVLHLLFAILPIALYLVTAGGMLQTIVMALLFMFGGLYFPLVWQTHMMKTFALFHPVDTKKKKQKSAPATTEVSVDAPATDTPSEVPAN